MRKSVGRNDVGEFEGYVVFLQLLDIGFTEVREDEELGVHILENFRCLVRREVHELGNDEVEMRLECNLGEVVEVVGEVTREEHALAVIGFYHVGKARDCLSAMLGTDSGDTDAVFIVEESLMYRVGMKLGVVFCVCPSVQAIDALFIGELDIPICLFVIPQAACDGGELCGMVAVHMCDKDRFDACDRDSVLGEQIDHGCSCINQKSVTVVFKIDRGAMTSNLGMSMAGA